MATQSTARNYVNKPLYGIIYLSGRDPLDLEQRINKMAKAKVKTATPKDAKAELAKSAIVKEFVNKYEYIESKERATVEELSPIFRKVANEMYLAVKVNKIWKSGRALADAMNKHHSVVQRYINAGEWLSTRTDEQLAKDGFFAYQAKTQLRKMKSAQAKTASAKVVKSAKGKSTKSKATCTHGTIDGVTTLLKTIAKTEKDVAKLKVLRGLIAEVIVIIDGKMITTPKGKALQNLVKA
jgi:hypothetical protein